MKLPGNQLESDEITQNRNTFLEKHSIDPQSVVSAELEHGNNIRTVFATDNNRIIPHVDGLITTEKDVYLSITVADCLPITLYDSKKNILCLLHAGWRGLEKGIIENAAKTLSIKYDIKLKSLIAEIGPAIGLCHYEVGKGVAEKFSHYPDTIIEKDSKVFLDLKKIAQKQLMELDILPTNIKTSDICTYCQSDTYFSHRKDKSEPVQAMMFVAGLH